MTSASPSSDFAQDRTSPSRQVSIVLGLTGTTGCLVKRLGYGRANFDLLPNASCSKPEPPSQDQRQSPFTHTYLGTFTSDHLGFPPAGGSSPTGWSDNAKPAATP